MSYAERAEGNIPKEPRSPKGNSGPLSFSVRRDITVQNDGEAGIGSDPELARTTRGSGGYIALEDWTNSRNGQRHRKEPMYEVDAAKSKHGQAVTTTTTTQSESPET